MKPALIYSSSVNSDEDRTSWTLVLVYFGLVRYRTRYFVLDILS